MPELLTAKQVAAITGVTEDTVWTWIRTKKIESIKLPSGRYRVTREAVNAALGVEQAKTPEEPETKTN